jgi:ATP-binding cassette subfamily C protein LapB
MANDMLQACLMRLGQLQKAAINPLVLQEAIIAAQTETRSARQLQLIASHLQLPRVKWFNSPNPVHAPALLLSSTGEWCLLRGQNGHGDWVIEEWDPELAKWRETAPQSISDFTMAVVDMRKVYRSSKSPVLQLIRREFFSQKRLLLEALLGSVLINIVALGVTFYTMQVYDRVIPTGASQTLMVLTLGVVIAIGYEFIAKKTRSKLFERLIDQIDQRLARSVFMRFLSVRLDQLPKSVGGLASQMRGYETVRSFLAGATTHLMVDTPFAIVFCFVVWTIAGWIAFIPLVFFFLSVIIGWYYRSLVDALADKGNVAANFKVGLLVETVEGAETIKSGQGGWRMLSRWMNTTDESRSFELQMRNINEHSQYLVASFQQFSHILIVASGALLVSRGELTMGGLIACSILSGRILTPIAAMPSQLLQWAHAKAALRGLEQVWDLQDDYFGQEQPVLLERINGNYRFDKVAYKYDQTSALAIDGLKISPGEKIGILGPVGAGKTTLLRLLSGMFKPQSGRILLDDIDLAQLSKPMLAENIGYVQQDGRLFAGSLRDNLTLGLLDPGDDKLLQAARQTGLLDAVITPNSQGLQQEIYEGGTGLSGGQCQLVHITRAFLREPTIWLLDEPTASMDRNLELQIISALEQALKPESVLVLVTHKPEMLKLVDRLLVVAGHQIVMDGPKLQVLQKLQTPPSQNNKQSQQNQNTHNLKPQSAPV